MEATYFLMLIGKIANVAPNKLSIKSVLLALKRCYYHLTVINFSVQNGNWLTGIAQLSPLFEFTLAEICFEYLFSI